MTATSFMVFDTAIGCCGLAWSEAGIAGVQLPEDSAAGTRARLGRRFPNAGEAEPTPEVQRAADAIVALLVGHATDLSFVALDMQSVPEFHRRVYEVVRTIPPGATLSYGEVAKRLGVPDAAQAVGHALGKNPFARVVPRHRVLAASGKMGGFTARGGVATKLRLLSIEGAEAVGGGDLFAGRA
jgi:methylated-DNA-[protein]-cysteine S-methyltransferase